ncbi:MAG TPA: CAP domain-containing protein, partial [Tepidiformaceae bacterium]|nr:CAP domain-containing protein [Tepidiformaceae bacterium]
MVSFEGVRHGTAGWGRPWKFTRQFSLYVGGAVLAAVVALAVGASSLGGETNRQAPLVGSAYPSNPAGVMPGVDELLALTQLPNTFSSSLPTAFTDNFDVPAPVAEPVVAAPEQTAPAAVPVNAAPASVPVEQPKPAPPPPAPAEKPNFYVPEVSAGGITNLEQRLFDGINTERANAGLAAYTYDAGLSKIARIRVQQMADQGYFAHTDPYGYSMYTELLARFGYRY